MKKRLPLFFTGIFLMGSVLVLSCKKKEDPAPAPTPTPAPSYQDYLTGNGTVKYWQPVDLTQKSSSGFQNLYLILDPCLIDNYVVFFRNGDYEERGFGTKCYSTERFVIASNKWEIKADTLVVGPYMGGSTNEISNRLFATNVVITHLDATRFKGFRVTYSGDTVRFVLSAVPM